MHKYFRNAVIRNYLIIICGIVADVFLVNLGLLTSYFVRYGFPFPERNFNPYENSFLYLTIIHISMLAFLGVFAKRFKSSWELFKAVFSGLVLGVSLSIVFVYVFRNKWGAFPSSVFAISFFLNLLIVFKFNQYLYKLLGRIQKKILVIGEGNVKDLILGKADVERISAKDLKSAEKYNDIDEILISTIPEENMEFITYLAQKLRINVVFSPGCYIKLLPQRINGNGLDQISSLITFVSRKRDAEEFMIRALNIVGSISMLILSLPVLVLVAVLIKITSKGPVFYTQERVGKDGLIYTLYKFRTMIHDAEKELGPVLASQNDPRVTKIGRFLRDTRLDEFPQLINVLLGQMSLVGPRPERPHFVKRHKYLMELRLAVRPGLTGLAQIRNAYDLHPKHKIKYDYLYIQSRSVMLNLYVLFKTIPVMVMRKGQ